MNHKKLTLAAVALALSVMTSRATEITLMVDTPYSSTIDPLLTPALWITGDWDVGPGAIPWTADLSSGLVNWSGTVSGHVSMVGQIPIYIVSFEGTHTVGAPVPDFLASLGMADVAGMAGQIFASILHNDPVGSSGDAWVLSANINPAGTMNFDIYAAHYLREENPSVPDAGSTSMLLGSALLGLALLRRRLF